MKGLLSKLKSSLAFNIIGFMVVLLMLFGLAICTVSLVDFTNIYKSESALSTYHMADTATTLVNGDHIDSYLAGEEYEEYLLSPPDSTCNSFREN